MSLAKTRRSIFNNFRIGMALLLPPVKPLPFPPNFTNSSLLGLQYYYPTTTTTYNYKEGLIIGIRTCSSSSSSSVSRDPKEDPNLVDNMREGVFRFQTSEGGETDDEAARNGRDYDYQAKDDEESDDKTETERSEMADMAKQGTVVKATETGISMGDKVKESMDNVWDAARETTHKIKEAVAAGDDDKEKRSRL